MKASLKSGRLTCLQNRTEPSLSYNAPAIARQLPAIDDAALGRAALAADLNPALRVARTLGRLSDAARAASGGTRSTRYSTSNSRKSRPDDNSAVRGRRERTPPVPRLPLPTGLPKAGTQIEIA